MSVHKRGIPRGGVEEDLHALLVLGEERKLEVCRLDAAQRLHQCSKSISVISLIKLDGNGFRAAVLVIRGIRRQAQGNVRVVGHIGHAMCAAV